jgi:hypothetical protein
VAYSARASGGVGELWSFEYLIGELRGLDRDAENASLELLNQLSRFPGRFEIGPPLHQQGDAPMFGERTLDDLERSRAYWSIQCRRNFSAAGPAVWLHWVQHFVCAVYWPPVNFCTWGAVQSAIGRVLEFGSNI